MKNLPPEMQAWYFPFDWDVSRLWALDVPVETRDISELRWHFDWPSTKSTDCRTCGFELSRER